MNTNLNFLSTPTVLPNGGSPLAIPTSGDGGPQNQVFQALLTGQMFKAERQGLAAQVMEDAGLQVISLGTKLNVITTGEPLPDLASLAAFARTQGLAETAIQALFGSTTAPKTSPAGLTQGQESATTLLNLGASAGGFEASSRFGQSSMPMLMPAGLALAMPLAGVLPVQQPMPMAEVQAKPAPGSAGQPASVPPTTSSLEGLSSLVIASAEPKTDSRDKKTLRLSAQDETSPTAASASTLLLTSMLFPNSPPALTQPNSNTGLASGRAVVATLQPTAPALPAASALPTQTSTHSEPALPGTATAPQPTAPALPGTATEPQPAKTSSLEGPKPVSIAAITQPGTAHTQPAVGVTAHAAAQVLPAAQAPDALAAAQVLAGSISAAWVAAKSGTSSQAAELGPDMRLDASAEESVQDAVRLTLSLPAPDLSKRLASKPGNTEVVNWAPLLANQQPNANKAPSSGPWENLHLAVPEGFDLEEQEGLLAAPEQDSGNNVGQPTQAGPLARSGTEPAQTARGEAALLAAQAEQRTVQQQQLADRLGEAAANRLIAQIERGEWKMQMRLQPGKLGRIDVELSMHARGLEAMFSADSALTRELIVQGTARLKETLAQAGMTVASMTVNGDQTRQSGGNSTPQQGYRAASDALPTKARVEEPRVVAQTAAVTATDRLNILA